MSKNFWLKLPKPFFCLAPMYDVTDAAWRFMLAKYGKPDVMFTEFVSCDGLCSRGIDKIMTHLQYDKKERPIVAQVFGNKPETFFKTGQLIKELGFDGLDINMGCPDKTIMKQGAGAALIKSPSLAQELIIAAQEGSGLPVSVKTRIGDTKNILDTWLPKIIATKPVAITVHARTRKEMSKVPARWEYVAEAVQMAKGTDILIIGNGDVTSLADGQLKAKQSGADGIMVGRGIFGNPWFFNRKVSIETITLEQKLNVLVEHTKLFVKFFGAGKNFHIMKKHYKAYVTGFNGASDLRHLLMQANNEKEVAIIIKNYLK